MLVAVPFPQFGNWTDLIPNKSRGRDNLPDILLGLLDHFNEILTPLHMLQPQFLILINFPGLQLERLGRFGGLLPEPLNNFILLEQLPLQLLIGATQLGTLPEYILNAGPNLIHLGLDGPHLLLLLLEPIHQPTIVVDLLIVSLLHLLDEVQEELVLLGGFVCELLQLGLVLVVH